MMGDVPEVVIASAVQCETCGIPLSHAYTCPHRCMNRDVSIASMVAERAAILEMARERAEVARAELEAEQLPRERVLALRVRIQAFDQLAADIEARGGG